MRKDRLEKTQRQARKGTKAGFKRRKCRPDTNSINTVLSHMGIHREITLFVRVSLAWHKF